MYINIFEQSRAAHIGRREHITSQHRLLSPPFIAAKCNVMCCCGERQYAIAIMLHGNSILFCSLVFTFIMLITSRIIFTNHISITYGDGKRHSIASHRVTWTSTDQYMTLIRFGVFFLLLIFIFCIVLHFASTNVCMFTLYNMMRDYNASTPLSHTFSFSEMHSTLNLSRGGGSCGSIWAEAFH